MSSKRIPLFVAGLSMLLPTAGCDQPTAHAEVQLPASAQPTAADKPAPAPKKTPGGAKEPGVKAPGAASETLVKRIVFIDKEQCCACTQRAIDATWTALQEGLGKDSKVPIERVHIDTQAATAGKYRAKRALVTVPAIYFLDEVDEVVELLQGEVTAEEVRAAIGK